MTAEEIARRLGGRRSGNGWVAQCPAHDDRSPSLSIRGGGHGRVLFKCFAGCDYVAIVNALGPNAPPLRDDHHARDHRQIESDVQQREKRYARAMHLWRKAMPITPKSVAGEYLIARELPPPWPPVLRWLPEAFAEKTARGVARYFPALVARLDDEITARTERPRAVQLTFVSPVSPGDKAPVSAPRLTYAAMGGAAIRLAPPRIGTIALAEGIETALAFTRLTGTPCWATCSAGRLKSIDLPPGVSDVVIAGDLKSQSEIDAAKCAAERYAAPLRGYRSRAVFPTAPHGDFNDQLVERDTHAG